MTPDDIILGALYKHKNHPNVVYLGCGDFFDGYPAKRKFMLILREPACPQQFSGVKVAWTDNDQKCLEWWSKFTAAPNKVFI